MIRRQNTRQQKRRGFTLIELLVVISIIAVLMSLILPAIQNAREAGRRTECLNNLKNLGLAMHNYATTNRSQLPAYGYFPNETLGAASGDPLHGRSWVVELLPYLDQSTISDRWDNRKSWDDGSIDTTITDKSNFELSQNSMKVLRCASRTDNNQSLSYVANAGLGNERVLIDRAGLTASVPIGQNFNLEPFDFNADSVLDPQLMQACGVFHADIDFVIGGAPVSKRASQTLDSFYDGAGNTIMLSESLNSGATPNAGGAVSWANPHAWNCTFIFPFLAGRTLNDEHATPALRPTHDPAQYGGLPYINEKKAGPIGTSPFLSSNHPSQVQIATGEGAARGISEDINKDVYIKLITPSATRLRAGFQSEKPIASEF